jgi:hypothetical protein
MTISAHIFEAFLHCPTKCWLQLLGEAGFGNMYSDWVQKRQEAYRAAGINRMMDDFREVGGIIAAGSRPLEIRAAK